jgi:hypothetical protein
MVSDRVLSRLIPSVPAVALFGDLIRAFVGLVVALCLAAWIAYYSVLVPMMFTKLHMNGSITYPVKTSLTSHKR